jgi:predicted ATP-dependent serine protease
MSGEVESVPEILKNRKPGAIIVDSVNGFVNNDNAKAVEFCLQMKKFSMEFKAPSIIISHVTKGDDFAGLMTLQHAVDTLMTLNPDEVTGIRTLEVLKNRFGRAFITSQYEMNEDGLSIIELDEDEEYEDDEDK